jgi:hypothetical protein
VPPDSGPAFELAAEALRRGDAAAAQALTGQILAEAAEARDLFPAFLGRAREYLLGHGVAPAVLAAEERRLAALLDPGGEGLDTAAAWRDLEAAARQAAEHCTAGAGEAGTGGAADAGGTGAGGGAGAGGACAGGEAAALLETARRRWCAAHDRACDWIYGLLDVAFRRLGEQVIGAMWDAIMGDLYATRDAYSPAVRPWRDSVPVLLADAVASLRGHLSGRARVGEVDVTETGDRWVISFDPCGSGGRTHRPDATGDGVARMEAPYGFAVTTGRHDWAWQREGICLYCVHCCQLQERVPIQRFGIPLRVVDPPTWPAARDGGRCTWTIYKRPEDIPPSVYARVGFRKPG